MAPSITALPTTHQSLIQWVSDIAAVTQPDDIVWCDGSPEEYSSLCDNLLARGALRRRDHMDDPNRYDTTDTTVSPAANPVTCSENPGDAGSAGQWKHQAEMREALTGERGLFRDSMRGRTMYVVPFCMGLHAPGISEIGVQITDSEYVVVSLRAMSRMGRSVLDELGADGPFLKAVHSLGAPLTAEQADTPWPSSDTSYIAHFPDARELWSFGSAHHGNAMLTLGKKCFAARIAATLHAREGSVSGPDLTSTSADASPTRENKVSGPHGCHSAGCKEAAQRLANLRQTAAIGAPEPASTSTAADNDRTHEHTVSEPRACQHPSCQEAAQRLAQLHQTATISVPQPAPAPTATENPTHEHKHTVSGPRACESPHCREAAQRLAQLHQTATIGVP